MNDYLDSVIERDPAARNRLNVLLNLFVTLTGLFVSSIVIGIIVTAITDRIESIRQGTGYIEESNHQLILGWSSGITLVFREFLLANENQKNTNKSIT